MDFEVRFTDEVRAIQSRFPGFKILEKKDSRLCTVIYWVLYVLTFGKHDFNKFDTVLGQRLYVNPHWHFYTWGHRWATLRHERIHLEQSRRIGLGCFWLGFPIFSLLYALVLPVGLTLRAVFEYEAYKETARCNRIAGIPTSRARLRQLFLGHEYFWMLPIPCLVDRLLDRLNLDP